jgi:hypothetical protein
MSAGLEKVPVGVVRLILRLPVYVKSPNSTFVGWTDVALVTLGNFTSNNS